MIVDPLHNAGDLRCLVLAQLGFATDFIADQCDMTPCQVQYRLGKYAIRRSEYRNGNSAFAEQVIKTAAPKISVATKEVVALRVPMKLRAKNHKPALKKKKKYA